MKMRQPLRPRSEDKRIFKYLEPSTNRRRADDQDAGCRMQDLGLRMLDPGALWSRGRS